MIVALVAVAAGGAGTGAFTTAALDRGSSIPIAGDENGVVGLGVSRSVQSNATSRLVTVTNTLDTSTRVTVSLDENARDDADLVVNGATEGDTANVRLAAGKRRSFDVDVAANATRSTLGFDVTATGGGVSVSAPDRSTTIST
ncbi:hypothetical protein [Halarchaeum acidiphilum]|uniref:hypothetical protein n=1 Tax=Halarchaeum acidiphilum TaxID=489138 RepID=UPI00067802E7|nr:hypothetical protein [Halarchaeum acidiphilum]